MSDKQKKLIIPFCTIWERYFFKEALGIFLLFLFCFYGLYVLIDFSTHAASFHRHHIHFEWAALARYYFSDFVKRIDVLVPFALLIATIKTLTRLNIHNELVALMASGIKLKTLLRPFVLFALFCVALAYLNTEFLLPGALNVIKGINNAHSNQKKKNSGHPAVQHLTLSDQSTLLFHHYDPAQQIFFDVYWIRSIDDIYHIKFLHPYAEIPLGKYVDHFIRTAEGTINKAESLSAKAFPELNFNPEAIRETFESPEDLAISDLHIKIPEQGTQIGEKEAQILSVYYHKLAMPWLCLLAVIGPAPLCIRYNRQLPIFFIYAGAIFSLVAIYLVIDASLILGKRQVLAPHLAIGAPFFLFSGLFFFRYYRMV